MAEGNSTCSNTAEAGKHKFFLHLAAVFGIPAAGASLEHVFSVAGQTVEDTHCQLKSTGGTVDGLLFLHELKK